MEKLINFLNNYVGEQDLKDICQSLETKQRKSLLLEHIFIKVGVNSDKLFFDNLVREINLYSNNKNLDVFPQIIDSYVSDNYCALILKRIYGSTVGEKRNEFCHDKLLDSQRLKICKDIQKIQNIQISGELADDHNRKQKIEKYLSKVQEFLPEELYVKINNNIEKLDKIECKKVISHSDLIPPNVMIENNETKFIDWEFISIKPESYDIAYFLLFSKQNNSLEVVEQLDCTNIVKNEIYKDGVVLCLKEINNWKKLVNILDKDLTTSMIDRWVKELEIIINGGKV